MSVVSVRARSFILALFIRDDGERFLLGDNGYDFIDSQLHFSANTIENDEVEKQGADGTMLAGQVRRASVQTFDGYVGDATTPKEEIEQMRRDFIAFFAKNHHFRVIYVDCNRNAWQRKGGYLVDAPEVKELWQIHPEYHVGLNFEDVNYYEYDENAEGQEILANIMKVPLSSDVEGGLVWDEDGAVSEDATVIYDGDTATASGTIITVSDAVEAPLSDFKLKGNTSQQTYSGKNLCSGVNQNYWLNAAAYSAGQTTGNSGIGISVSANTYYTISTKVSQARYRAAFVDSLPTSNAGITAYGGQAKDGTSDSITINSGSHGYLIVNATSLTDIQIEVGSSATPFEPYVGGTASPNPDYPQAVQTVTGENVVKICKKNLFDVSAIPYVAKRAYGSDGSELICNNYSGIDGYQQVAPNTTYTITKGASGSVSYLCEYDKNKAFIQRKTNQRTFTTTANTHYLRWSVYSQGDVAPTQTQLELGSTATAYEPYQGQSYEVNLGKNLFDGANANARTGYILNDSGTEISDNTGGYTRNYSAVRPNTTYTISGMAGAGTRRIYFYNGGKTFLSRTSGYSGAQEITFTTPANCYFVNVQIYTNTDDATAMASWQLELGSTATSYAAYFEPIELCNIPGTDYRDRFIPRDGKWYVRKEVGKYVYNDDLTGNGISSTLVAMLTPALPIAPNLSTLDGVAVSNMYGTISTEITKLGGTTSISCIRVNTSIDIADSYNAVKALAAANNLTIYYALATPTDTEITNAALIAQLEAILSQGKTYAGTNNITTVIATGNEQGELEITYYTTDEVKVVGGGYVWEEGGSGGPTVIVNESISAVSPVWTVYGPALNPQLENATNGDVIEYVGLIAEGQTLVIDMGEQTAKLDGLNVISNVTGDFISLESGANTLLYSAGNDAPESEIGWSEIVG